MERFREDGPTVDDVQKINSRVVGSPNGPTEEDLPKNAAYACRTNTDRMAINDGIFVQHLQLTHSKDPEVIPPKHTVCVKASNLAWWKGPYQYQDMNKRMKDYFHATVGEAHIEESKDTKSYDPMLKLYYHRPVMINDNIDVENGLSNGTMCKFIGLNLKAGVEWDDLERIQIDGYYVWCANVTQVKSLRVQLLDGLETEEEVKMADLVPKSRNVTAEIPIALDGSVTKHTPRRKRKCRLRTFSLNIANARTVHKLQGRSLQACMVNSWQYKENWAYVALSRVRTIQGLFLRIPLDHSNCKPMQLEIRQFLERMRKKRPGPPVELSDYDSE